MAKFGKFFFGGVVGAGLALMFAPKTGREMRRLLTGGGRPALPPPPPPVQVPVAKPAEVAGGGEISLESRIEETRRQVESQLAPEEALDAPTAPAPVEDLVAPVEFAPEEALAEAAEAAMIEEDIVVEEAPAEFAAEREAAAPEAEAVEFPSEEAEAELAGEELAAIQDEAAAAEGAEGEREAEAEVEQETGGRFAGGQTLAELAQEHEQIAEAAEEARAEAGTDEFAALRTPADGEPTVEPAPAEEAPPQPERSQASRLDQEEMRRRINETRDRLKAKAFDAMVSGETFIETGADKSRRERPTSPDLEKDVEEQIDDSLREEY